MKLVIVGGVAGGASAAARARRLDESSEIIVMERGPYVSFANCGLPYHISGAIKKRDDLFISTPRNFKENYNIDIRTAHEAIQIDRGQKLIHVKDLASGHEYDETYDKLILSQGASPTKLDVPGADHPSIFSLRDIPDMDRIISTIDGGAASAVVIGAGYIGMEISEALRQRGLDVTVVELQEQVLPVFDRELVTDVHVHLVKKGISLRLGDSVREFSEVDGNLKIHLNSGELLNADLCIVAIGVKPETAMARSAGLDIGNSHGVLVDPHMRTSDPDIYAVGDMVEVTHTITSETVSIPLAGPANRQGRIAADHINGRDSLYTTTQGTAIVKVFDMTAALTGAAEKDLKRAGIPFEKIYLWPFGHASYYPGSSSMQIKLLLEPGKGTVLGAQIVGLDGVDKRIDIFALAVRMGLTVYDLEQLELAYAPPYGSAKDPVNMAGFVGANVLKGDVKFWYAEDHSEKTSAGTVIDVRSPREFSRGHIEGAVNIPIGQVRERMEDVGKLSQPLFIYCLTGIRSYLVFRILFQNGFNEIFNLAGGWKTFESCHRKIETDGSSSVLFTE